METDNTVEIRIMEAARKVFYRKGKGGASMQDIAAEAGITRTSLNYYYRTKDKLFDAVFTNAMEQFVPRLAELLASASSFTDYLKQMVDVIIDSMIERPEIPVFVLQELTSNPGKVPALMSELGIHPAQLVSNMTDDEVLGNLSIDPRQVMINVLSLCIFPFASKPLLVSAMYNGDEEAYISAMKKRKEFIPEMIESMIKNFEK